MDISCVFIDTNILLHYQPIEDIPWKEVVGAEEVIICIAPIVVEELDDQKDSHRLTKIRQRARKALHLIEESVSSDNFRIRDGVWLQYMSEPDISFSEYGLRENKPDHNLVASLLSFDKESQEIALLITGDAGPRIKAGSLNLPAMKLPDEYRAESALSAIEKKYRKLQQKVHRLENRLPELDLVFEGSKKHCKFQITEYKPPSKESIEERLKEIRAQHPKKGLNPPEDSGNTESLNAIFKARTPLFAPSKEQIEKYNKRLERFYEEYKEYLQLCEAMKWTKARMIKLATVQFGQK